MQGLRELWNLPRPDYTWAAAGYQGAINSGHTTCGLLIGSTIAIGLRYGQGKECIPMEDEKNRSKAIEDVNELYKAFIAEFGNAICSELIHCDFSKPEEKIRYRQEEVYKHTCFKYFKFIMDYFFEKDRAG